MKEHLASGPTLWRNKVTAFCLRWCEEVTPQAPLLFKGCPGSALERRQSANAALILIVAAATINHAPSQMHLWAKVSGTSPVLWHLSTPLSSHTWSGHVGTRITGRRAVISDKPGAASRAFLARVTKQTKKIQKQKQTKETKQNCFLGANVNNLPV